MAKVSPARGRLASRHPQFAGAFSTKGICSLPSPFARKALPIWKYLGPRHSQSASPLLAEGTPNLGDPCQSKGPAPGICRVQVAIPWISPVLLGIPEPPLWGVQVESMLAALPICGVHMYPADQVGGGNGSEDGLAAASCSRLDVCAFYNRKQLNRGFNKVLCRLAQLRPAPHQSGSALVQLVMLH